MISFMTVVGNFLDKEQMSGVHLQRKGKEMTEKDLISTLLVCYR